jgi:putative hydrolase of the HAD superfamily
MGNIKGVIFDFGGVISRPQDQGYVNQLMDLLQVTDWERFMRVYMELRSAYDGGQISGEEYWEAVIDRLGCARVPVEKLTGPDIRSWTVINEDTLAFAADLRDHGIVTAVLSNMNTEVLTYLKRECPRLDEFDHLVYSCDLGMIKPHREIYDICVSRMGLKHAECLFLDDTAANVHAAEKYGLKARVFEGQKTLNAIKREFFCNIFAEKMTQ